MLSLHTNAASLSTQNNLHHTQGALSTSLTRLGTGFRINSAMDDAAGLQIATRLNAQASGMSVAMRNTQNGISMMQTAEGAFSEMTNILTRMKDLSTQAADASSTANDQKAMQAEYDSLGLELSNIMKNTSFGGQALLDKTTGTLKASITFQIGSSAAETMAVDLSASLGAAGTLDTALKAVSKEYYTNAAPAAGNELLTGTSANGMITAINTALDEIGTARSALGANSNRLDHVYNNLSNMKTATEEAKGRIMDVDYASESANMTTHQMLMQAGTSMLKQSNSMSQLVMSLMQ